MTRNYLKPLFLWLILTGVFSWAITACNNNYNLAPLAAANSPTHTPTATFTATPSGCNGGNTGNVTTYAGTGATGSANGPALSATFNLNSGLAEDSAGNIYVSDEDNQLIREISPGGIVSTYAGSGSAGSANGTGTAASFNFPYGVAVDSAGNVYIGDQENNLIRKIAPGAVVTTLAGSGAPGAVNGTGTAASFSLPAGVAVDSAGNVYVVDRSNNLIRKITPGGVVTTLAGSGVPGAVNGTGTAASFSGPTGVAVDSAGNVYVGDTNNELIRKITPGGVVSTLAGSGIGGFVNGPANAAQFSQPTGVTVDNAGNVYVADTGNEVVRLISGGVVSTLAGSGTAGHANGIGTAASFDFLEGIYIDSSCRIFVGDIINNKVREIQ